MLRKYPCLFLVSVLVAACSSSAAHSSLPKATPTTLQPGIVSVADVRAAMIHARTARIRGSATIADAKTPTTTATLTGFVLFTSPEEYDVIGKAGATTIEHVVIGRDVLTRGNLGAADDQAWCRSSTNDYPTITIQGALFSVKPSDAQPVRVGEESIGSTPTTHYRLSPKDRPVVDYWIDNANRIARMRWNSDEGEHDAIDLNAYGALPPSMSLPDPAQLPTC